MCGRRRNSERQRKREREKEKKKEKTRRGERWTERQPGFMTGEKGTERIQRRHWDPKLFTYTDAQFCCNAAEKETRRSGRQLSGGRREMRGEREKARGYKMEKSAAGGSCPALALQCLYADCYLSRPLTPSSVLRLCLLVVSVTPSFLLLSASASRPLPACL